MGASTFRFQQFVIEQDQCAMKISTDGIMLGAWAPDLEAGRVLDIGTGTGLLALMYAQSNPHVQIDALEIDPLAAAQARDNFESSPWVARLQLYAQALQDFEPDETYDLFLCNPPYFDAGIIPSENARAQARHDRSLDFETLVTHCTRLASNKARLALILPAERQTQMLERLASQDWFLHKRTLIQASPVKKVSRVLLLVGRENDEPKEGMLIIRDEKSNYSSQYQQLTRSYYLSLAFE